MCELVICDDDDCKWSFFFHSEEEAYNAWEYIESTSNYHKVALHNIEVFPNVESFKKRFKEECVFTNAF